MSTRAPVSRIYTGKRGRPKIVRSTARTVIAEHIQDYLELSGLFFRMAPVSKRRAFCRDIAQGVLVALETRGLCVIPDSLKREFALLAGEAPEASKALAPVVGADNNERKA